MTVRSLFAGVSARKPPQRPDALPRCPRCGSKSTAQRSRAGLHSGLYYCYDCFQLFRDAPVVPFECVADGWTRSLGKLQAAGEIIAVRLPHGFVGVSLLAGPHEVTGHPGQEDRMSAGGTRRSVPPVPETAVR